MKYVKYKSYFKMLYNTLSLICKSKNSFRKTLFLQVLRLIVSFFGGQVTFTAFKTSLKKMIKMKNKILKQKTKKHQKIKSQQQNDSFHKQN